MGYDDHRVLVATLPLPPSANQNWRYANGHAPYLSEQAINYKAHVSALLFDCDPFTSHVEMSQELYMNRKTGDIDNRVKVLNDALQGYFYENDRQVVKLTVTLCAYDYDNPRVVVRCWKASAPPDIRGKKKDRQETVYGYQQLVYALTQDEV